MARPGKKANSAKEEPFSVDASPHALESASGSKSSHFQRELIEQVAASLWLPKWKTAEQGRQALRAAYEALQQISPRSELEGMLAAQMISTHNAAMECLRRAMIEDQTFAGREQNLKHAAKLLSTYERQLAALDKHRGKGQQKITVEHVTVEAGGQAIVGNVHAGEGNTPTALSDERSADALNRVPHESARRRSIRPDPDQSAGE